MRAMKTNYRFIISLLAAILLIISLRSASFADTNTTSTGSKDKNVKVMWMAFDQDGNLNIPEADEKGVIHHDYLYIKFSEPMKSDGENGVTNYKNYKIDGKPLNQGSKIIKGINGVTSGWDGITIEMPADTINRTGQTPHSTIDFGFNVELLKEFNSVENIPLEKFGEFRLRDSGEDSPNDSDMIFESRYPTNPVSTLELIHNASALGRNGKIEYIELKDFVLHPKDGSDFIMVNGIKYVHVSGPEAYQMKSFRLYKPEPGKAIDQTTTENLKITRHDSLIIDAPHVRDALAPVVKSAKINRKKTEITVTFSEPVTTDPFLTKKDIVTNETENGKFFSLNSTSANQKPYIKEIKKHNGATVVLGIANGKNLHEGDSISVDLLYDYPGNHYVQPIDYHQPKPAAPTGNRILKKEYIIEGINCPPLTKISQKEPTVTDDGIKEHYKSENGELFEDADGEIKTSADKIRIPKISYNLVNHNLSWDAKNKDDLTLIVKRSYKDKDCIKQFKNVSIDDNTLLKNDFDIAAGSLKLTFHNDYLKKLSNGKHQVTINFRDGGVVKAELSISNDSVNKNLKPPTGDSGLTKRYIIICLVALAIILLLIFIKKKR